MMAIRCGAFVIGGMKSGWFWSHFIPATEENLEVPCKEVSASGLSSRLGVKEDLCLTYNDEADEF